MWLSRRDDHRVPRDRADAEQVDHRRPAGHGQSLEIAGKQRSAPNVTIRQVWSRRPPGGERGLGDRRPKTAENLVIEDSEIGTQAGTGRTWRASSTSARPTMRRLNIHGCSAGVSTGGGLLEDSYVHDMSSVPGLSHIVGVASTVAASPCHHDPQHVRPDGSDRVLPGLRRAGRQPRDRQPRRRRRVLLLRGSGTKGATGRSLRRQPAARSIFPTCGSFGVMASFTPTDPGNSSVATSGTRVRK